MPKLRNEYLDRFMQLQDFDPHKDLSKVLSADAWLSQWAAREQWAKRYAWAVPSEEAIDTIAKYGPILEIGAGTGYWAYLLRGRGVRVAAFDADPPAVSRDDNIYHANTRTWTRVRKGGPEQVAKHPRHTLFLCWPPYDASMAYECLLDYEGATFLYVGEWGGCTGCNKFHSLLEARWEMQETVWIPNYAGVHDALFVLTRK